MKIQIINRKGQKTHTNILKKHLPNYKKINKNTYIRKELYNKFKKLKETKNYQTVKGTTEYTNKKYIRYTFKLYRTRINTFQEIDKFFTKIIKKYSIVQNKNKNYKAQRIGINIASDPRDYKEWINKKTKRQNKKELFDFITTSTYRRDKNSTDAMFLELELKIQNYAMDENYTMLLEGEKDKKAKEFFIIFTQE